MKLLVFAHTPPPHHGQSYMVQLMLAGLGEDEYIHVDARLSRDMADVGETRGGKVWALARYILQAWVNRVRKGADTFYYIPAPGKRSALYRDWVIYLLCRPLFRQWIMHWHAVGLARWLETEAKPWERWVTLRLAVKPTLSIAVTEMGSADARYFGSKNIQIVPNGLPDACPDFNETVLPFRLARCRARGKASPANPVDFHLLFMAHCTEMKGLFIALEAVARARSPLLQKGIRLQLTVAGHFTDEATFDRFTVRISQPDLLDSNERSFVTHCGFLDAEAKSIAFRKADCYLFPSQWESFGLVLLEAMMFGLPIVTIAGGGGGVQSVMPKGDPGLVPIEKGSEGIADALIGMVEREHFLPLRDHYLQRFSDREFHRRMRQALNSLTQKSAEYAAGKDSQ